MYTESEQLQKLVEYAEKLVKEKESEPEFEELKRDFIKVGDALLVAEETLSVIASQPSSVHALAQACLDKIQPIAAALDPELAMKRTLVDIGRNAIELRPPEWVAQAYATAFEKLLKSGNAQNYVEVQFTDSDNKPLTVTVQKHDRLTPHQARQEAEKRAEVAEAKVKELSEENAELNG